MSDRPNVIICMCDQLRAFELGCYGNNIIKTPNIDSLASEGICFETAVSNNPVCMPARSATISGQYSRTCGPLQNYVENGVMPDYPVQKREQMQDITIAEAFKQLGYDTSLFGKWHIHPAPDLLGFDYCLYPLVRHRYTNQTFIECSGKSSTECKVKGFSVDFEIESVEQYLETHKNNPFFMFYNISPPHMPLADAPEKYINMYSPDDIQLRPNVYIDGKLAQNETWMRIYLWDYLYYEKKLPHTTSLPEDFDLQRLIAMYYGMTTWVDDTVGRLMKSLISNGLVDNTIVVFTSDHGDLLGSHHRFNKDVLMEESIRIPMIYHCSEKIKKHYNTTQITQLIDIMPTLLDLCGSEIPASVQGRSIAPLLTGQQEILEENFAFIETPLQQIGLRTATHLYGIQLDTKFDKIIDDQYCFYDLRRDAFEQNNLAKTKVQSGISDKLRKKLLDWHRKTPFKEDVV